MLVSLWGVRSEGFWLVPWTPLEEEEAKLRPLNHEPTPGSLPGQTPQTIPTLESHETSQNHLFPYTGRFRPTPMGIPTSSYLGG